MELGAPLQQVIARPAIDPDGSLAAVIEQLAKAAITLADLIARGAMVGDSTRTLGRSGGGDLQRTIDLEAHAVFRDAVRASPVAAFVSEEAQDIEILDPAAALCVALDPLDGSGNTDLNMPTGTIFSICDWPPGAEHRPDFVWPAGLDQRAAGLVIYGAQTTMVLATGDSIDLFTLDPASADFRLTRPDLRMPAVGPDEYAVNMSNYRHWDAPVRAHIHELLAGATGPYGRDFNMRWHGALVAEAYRILGRGGLYMYPGDAREGYRDGRLRLVYEAYPIAFLTERAGGTASNGQRRILDLTPQSLHQHVPLVFGSPAMVGRVEEIYRKPELWSASISPLFGSRGLFRT